MMPWLPCNQIAIHMNIAKYDSMMLEKQMDGGIIIGYYPAYINVDVGYCGSDKIVEAFGDDYGILEYSRTEPEIYWTGLIWPAGLMIDDFAK